MKFTSETIPLKFQQDVGILFKSVNKTETFLFMVFVRLWKLLWWLLIGLGLQWPKLVAIDVKIEHLYDGVCETNFMISKFYSEDVLLTNKALTLEHL